MSDQNRTQMLSGDPNRTVMGADPNKTIMGVGPSIEATQTIKPVQCPVCKTFNPAAMIFCMECGLIFDRALPDDAFGAPAVQLPMVVDANGREQAVRPGANVIGREADLSFPDPRISRRHAQITNENGGCVLEDLGSTNGTKLDGNALSPGQKVALKGGERISLGGFEIQFNLPGGKGGNVTQAFAGNRTAAISAPPKAVEADAWIVGGDIRKPLKKGANSFGRKDHNDVQIPDPYVSGTHGTIEVTDDGYFLTDTGSSNGTVLNDAKLQPNMRTRVTAEDVIRLGSLELKIEAA